MELVPSIWSKSKLTAVENESSSLFIFNLGGYWDTKPFPGSYLKSEVNPSLPNTETEWVFEPPFTSPEKTAFRGFQAPILVRYWCLGLYHGLSHHEKTHHFWEMFVDFSNFWWDFMLEKPWRLFAKPLVLQRRTRISEPPCWTPRISSLGLLSRILKGASL